MIKRLLTIAALVATSFVGAKAQVFQVNPRNISILSNDVVRINKAASINPSENQKWWGYYMDDGMRTALGIRKAETYDQAMLLDCNTYGMLRYKTIKAVRIYLRGTTGIKDIKLWISKELPEDINEADYIQSIVLTDLQGGDSGDYYNGLPNDITLTTPYNINEERFIIGLTYTITSTSSSACQYPVVTGYTESIPYSLLLRTSKTVPEWEVLGDSYGPLAMQLLLEGEFAQNAASIKDFGTSYALIGKSTNVPVSITNEGATPIKSISYTIATNGTSGEEKTIAQDIAGFMESKEINIQFQADPTAEAYEKTLVITKVNGVENESSSNSATGKLITILKSTTAVPVIEEYTGTWCGYCPAGIVGMEKAENTFGDKAVLMAVHKGDVMEIDDYDDVDTPTGGYPGAALNRETSFYPNSSQITSCIQQGLKRVVAGSVETKAAWADDSKTAIQFDTKTTFQYSENNGQYGIAYVVVADGLKGETSSWNQSNYYSGQSGSSDMQFWYNAGSSVSNMEYNHVPVAAWNILYGAKNSVNSNIVAGETQEYRFKADISGKSLIQDKTKLKVVTLLVSSTTGLIINAAQTTIDEFDTNGIKVSGEDTSSREVQRYNAAGQVISTPQRGLNIIRMSNGTVRKVLVK